MKFTGNAIKYGDNVDTDVIIPARYLNTIDKKELASHCMEDLDKTFVTRVQEGDIMVAGNNFGCGSSREHAPIAIKESGISLVIANSFARIFYRNSINIGLAILLMPMPQAFIAVISDCKHNLFTVITVENSTLIGIVITITEGKFSKIIINAILKGIP